MKSDVPAPTNLMLERQLSTSFIIGWSPPSELSQDDILAYNIYSNGLFLTTVRSDDRTKALLEKLDPTKVGLFRNPIQPIVSRYKISIH